MKTKVVNFQSTIVCDTCEKEFKIGDKYSSIYPDNEVEEFTSYMGVYRFPYSKPYKEMSIYHTDCYNKANTNSLNSIKETLNQLSKEERRSLYLFLYNAHGCRI